MNVNNDKQILVRSVETSTYGPKICTRSQVVFSNRTFIILNTKANTAEANVEYQFDVQFFDLLEDEYPNSACIPVLYKTGSVVTADIFL